MATGTYEIIVGLDIILGRIIDLIVRLVNDEEDEATKEELIANANEMDARRREIMNKIRSH